MPTEVQGDVPGTSGSGSGSTTASGTTPDRDGSSTDVLQRETGRSILHPDVTFGAAPHAHILHIVSFVACCLTSIGCLIAQLPINADRGSTNWWSVLLPQLVFPLISIAFHGYSIIPTVQRRAIRMQLGDTPDPSTMNNGSVLQHQVLERVFRKTYIASNCSDIALYVSIVAAVTVLLVQLEMGRGTEAKPVLWRMVGLPIALGGLAAVIIQTLYRVRNRGAFPTISTRSDFAVIFVFLAAYKLDRDSLSWTITFIFLFWWIIAFVLLGMAGIIVYHAGRRAHLWNRTELNVRLGVSLVHLSYILLLVAAVFFFKLLRGGGADGKPYKLSSSEGARLFTICLSMTAAWVIASSVAQIAVFRGQKQREEERETQMSEGRVWTRWTGGASSEMATIVRQVDALSPEEIIKKASEMMQNVSKPTRLYRMDTNLWSTEPKAESNTTAAAEISAVDGTPTPVCGKNTTECRQCTGPDVATGDNAETESAQAGPSHVSDSANFGISCSEVAVNIPALSAAPRPAIKHSDSLGGADSMENDKDMSCLICFEELGDHVMMPCGHGGYCKHCAHKLYVRPPNLCPICRASLVSVVKVSLDTPIGSSTGVS